MPDSPQTASGLHTFPTRVAQPVEALDKFTYSPLGSESPNSSKWQISINGGFAPHWRGDGKELLYFEGSKLMAAEIRTSGRAFQPTIPKMLFEATPYAGPPNFAPSADGHRFLLTVPVESEAAMPITLLLNWTGGIQK